MIIIYSKHNFFPSLVLRWLGVRNIIQTAAANELDGSLKVNTFFLHQCISTPVYSYTSVFLHQCILTPVYSYTNVYFIVSLSSVSQAVTTNPLSVFQPMGLGARHHTHIA
jgi:hypothetical protein